MNLPIRSGRLAARLAREVALPDSGNPFSDRRTRGVDENLAQDVKSCSVATQRRKCCNFATNGEPRTSQLISRPLKYKWFFVSRELES
jgi:hypothetical protein